MRYVIRAGQPVVGKHWELEFDKGVAETDSAVMADRYRKRGYNVTDTQPEPVTAPEMDAPASTAPAPKKTGRKKKEG